MKQLLFLFSLIIFTIACSEERTPAGMSGDPTNLNVDILVYDDGSGIIVISASATDAVEYQYLLGDKDDSEFTNASGDLEFKYKTSGNYTVIVKAVGSNGRFLQYTENIFVPAEEPISVGEGYITPITYPDMNLIWNDEFDGTSLNTNIWSYDNGDGCPNLCGWGNNELEYYRPENSSFANGIMTITAKQEQWEGRQYTSTKIVSRNKQAVQYGRIDCRALLPKGQGLWPAIWLLGTNQPSVGWPKCGEIDIMEMVGGSGRENRITANIFYDNNGQRDEVGGYILDDGFFYDKYHVFSLIWNETQLVYLVDDQPYHTVSITSPAKTEFHNPFYAIINVAVGGNHPGNPDNTTILPTSMSVDYFRVFQDK